MGVYIKGMEMPTNADMAPTAVWVYPNGYAIVFKDNGRMKQYTQAAPVPSHGRLIDADALGNSLEKMAADKWNQKAAPVNWSYAFEECLEMVDNAPTIIEQNFIKAPTTPAEEGE